MNERVANGRTALHFESEIGNLTIAKFLLSEGCNAKVRDREGRTAVDIAALNGRLEVVRELSTWGSSLKTVSSGGRTILHHAVTDKDEEGDDHSDSDSYRESQLRQSLSIERDHEGGDGGCGIDHTGVLEFLLLQNLDVNATDNDECTPLHCLVQTGCLSSLAALLRHDGVKVDAHNRSGESALLISAKLGLTDIVTKLVEAGADINTGQRW